jgi:hypothetical protein
MKSPRAKIPLSLEFLAFIIVYKITTLSWPGGQVEISVSFKKLTLSFLGLPNYIFFLFSKKNWTLYSSNNFILIWCHLIPHLTVRYMLKDSK